MRSAGGPTTTGSASSSRSRAPTRSTSGCTPSASADRRFRAAFDELPDGTFVLEDGEAWLLLGDELLRWTPGGYAERRERPAGDALLITPPTTVDVLRAGWAPVVPFIHPSAFAL